MKRIRAIVIAAAVIAVLMLTIHLTLNINWPELLGALHGR